MGISSINYALGASYGAYSQKLTQATKSKLEALGIPYDPKISEEEAKKLIIKTQAPEKEKQAHNESLFQQNNNNSNSLFERLKKLADKLGIQINENANFQEIISTIENKIKEQIQTNKSDINSLKELKSISQELSMIKAQTGSMQNENSSEVELMHTLEMLGKYNKNFLK